METSAITVKSGASLNRHRSFQAYSTPHDFIVAVEKRFGRFSWDLAADHWNTKCINYIDKEQDSFTVAWHELIEPTTGEKGLLWLNCPFDNITPWARKCAEEAARGAKILFLTPASVGSNWFVDYVHKKAMVFALNPRLCFDGKNPYPKDCILSYYSLEHGFDVWRWKQ